MAIQAFWRSKLPFFASSTVHDLLTPITERPTLVKLQNLIQEIDPTQPTLHFRHFHDRRPRGPLWRGKKLIGREALFVIVGLMRFKDDYDDDKLDKFIKMNLRKLLKMDMIAVLGELERQEEVTLSLKIFRIIQKQEWYKPDVFMYKELIIALAKTKKMEEAIQVWESMRKKELFPDSH